MCHKCLELLHKSLIYECVLFCQGQIQTYTWYIPKTAGPTDEQEECNVGAYYSTIDVNKVGLWYLNVQYQFKTNQWHILIMAWE